jgi:hypothetical protein
MNTNIYVVHALIASILALGPLSIALYLDLKHKHEVIRKNT